MTHAHLLALAAHMVTQQHQGRGWLVYQFELYTRFHHLKHVLWTQDKYRMVCSGFHHVYWNRSPFKLLAKITCRIREVHGYVYPAP